MHMCAGKLHQRLPRRVRELPSAHISYDRRTYLGQTIRQDRDERSDE